MVYGKPPSPLHQAAHDCGNGHRGCVNWKHLARKTPIENLADKRKHGTAQVAEASPSTKLTREQVAEIVSLLGTQSERAIGQKFGVSSGTVRRIRLGDHWAVQS